MTTPKPLRHDTEGGGGAHLSDCYLELAASIRGAVYVRGDPSFYEYSQMFNGDVKVVSLAVACPLDAEDVSTIVRFCWKHELSLSVKAGGYGTAGWAVGGDVIVDLSKIVQVEIEAPGEGEEFTSIRDMPPPGNKNKARDEGNDESKSVDSSLVVERSWSGKRRRDDDARLRDYSLASESVDSFLHPQTDRKDTSDDERPAARRRTDDRAPSDDRMPSPGVEADPFGYLEEGSSEERPAIPSTSQLAQSIPNTMFASPAFLNSVQNTLTYATPIHSRAFITFGAGMRQKEIDQFSAMNPLEAVSLAGGRGAVPYFIPFAAHPVGSAAMLLGGFGFLGRLHGLSIDNLVEAEVVLADGQVVIVSEKEHPELWWALRGAGPAFGIVTRYKACAYPVPVVFAGNLIYRFHRATTPSLIKHFRDCVKGAPRELYANVLLTAGPAGQDSLVVVQMCYIGPKIKGQEFLQAISSWDGERCLLNEVDEKSFLHQQDSVAQVLRGKAGNKWFIRSALINSLPDEIINRTVLQFSETPVGCTWLFELTGGAIADIEDSCLPKTQRKAAFHVAALHQWDINFEDPRCIESAEEWISDTLAPVTIGGPLPSFLGRLEPPGRVMACFGENWPRLARAKREYDPENVFRNSFWPLDAAGEVVPPEQHEPEHVQF